MVSLAFFAIADEQQNKSKKRGSSKTTLFKKLFFIGIKV